MKKPATADSGGLGPRQGGRNGSTIGSKTLRLPAALLFLGFTLYVTMGLLHPGGPANNHGEVFEHYASSGGWTAVHLGQFVGMAVITAGLLALYFAHGPDTGGAAWLARLGAVCAVLALGLYCILQAVDGVALKQSVDAWVAAPEAEEAARFASAETVRWVEWGTRSYQSFMFGLALLLLGSAVALAVKLPRALGYLMGLSGLAYIVQGWVLGTEGFSQANTSAILAGYLLMLAWIVWLLMGAWRKNGALRAPTR